MAPDDLGRQLELFADRAHLVLEQGAKRLDELELQVLGQPAHVVVALDVGRAGAATALDDVRVERALDEELHLLTVGARLGHDLGRGVLEDADELAADDLALLLRIDDAGQRVQEATFGVHDLEPDASGGHEVLLDLLGLSGPQADRGRRRRR